MPTFEYSCHDCNVAFEELHILRDDIENYKDNYPCPSCGKNAERNRVSAFGFKFSGETRGTSGVHGNSGVHDLDYPKLDKAVGRSADKKWEKAREVQKEIASARLNSPTGAVSMGSNGVAHATPSSVLSSRETLLKKSKE